jgi:small-conductance mechanosensitive channel
LSKKLTVKLDKASEQEKKRRLKFLITLGLFLLIILFRIQYPELLKEDIGIPDRLERAVMFYMTVYILISFTRLSLVAIYLRRQQQQSGFRNNFVIGINQIANLLSFFALFIAILMLSGIDLKEFFTSLTIIAAAIAILFKDYINNMINGLIIMFSEQVSIDDYVKIGDHVGMIVDITLLNVHLLNEDDDLIFIANSTIMTGNVVNLTKNNQKKIILEFALQPDQIEGLNEMERYLCDSLQEYEEHIRPESAQMRVVNINNNSVTIKFQLVLYRQNRRMERDIRRHLNWNIISYINTSKKQQETV